MATFGVECRQCGDRIIAPESSEYSGEAQTVRHLWRCAKCGSEFETRIALGANAPLAPELVERFLPALLVA